MEKLISIRYGKFVKVDRGWLEVRLVDLLVGGPLFCRQSWRGSLTGELSVARGVIQLAVYSGLVWEKFKVYPWTRGVGSFHKNMIYCSLICNGFSISGYWDGPSLG